MDFKHVPKEYRPIPFWSWNEKLDVEETKGQIGEMDEAGLGGFFMHARGGMQTTYMGPEWFDNVSASVEEAHKRGMYPWAYDESGWPSGFGDGVVNALGVAYQQKYLRMETEPTHQETAICKCGEHYFYYEVNPYYVDTLDKKVIAKFIEVAYKPYYDKYGNAIEGFFTDEPQISRNGIPWSFVFEEEYKKRYGEHICEHLEELFLEKGDYKKTRIQFWKMVTELFSESYMKQIYEQCDAWGMKFTGHLVLEESLLSQVVSNGACMPHYEYMHMPGMDWLGRNIKECLTPYQVSSVAEQLGKNRVLAESFACCGHNVSFAELKGIYEWQMVHGINALCPHLEGYSIRGIRKRDYPPALFTQQPWWKNYGKLVEALSRESMILAKSEKKVDVLVLHPQTTAWSLYNDRDNTPLEELQDKFMAVIKELEQKHIVFHLGDEIILERHGKVEDGKLVVGKQAYTYVIDSVCEEMLSGTKALLEEFVKSGGRLTTVEALPANEVVDHPEITYTKGIYDGGTLHYFVNTSSQEKTAYFKVKGKVIDIYTGELHGFDGQHTFEPWGSLMLFEDGKEADTEQKAENPAKVETCIYPSGNFSVVGEITNCLTLDVCDYYFDGELQEKNGYVLNICERANRLERRVQIHQDYHVMVRYVPKKLHLVCETPEKFVIKVNGKLLDRQPDGYFADKSFKTIDIADYVQPGVNTISFDTDFYQSEEFYKHLRQAYLFESEKNKLTYDMEIEAIYLIGDFSVNTPGSWTQLENQAVRYQGDFELDAPKRELCLKNIEQQGYPFFCGEMVLEGSINITGEHPVFAMDRCGINAVKLEIDGMESWMLTKDKLSLKEFGVQGETKIRLTFVNNLRNLLGPHHLKIGELIKYGTGPHRFFKESCVWNVSPEASWCDEYCFVETGIS